VATAATAVTGTGFTANWNAYTDATSYRLDVSTVNTFASFVPTYQNKAVTGTSSAVTGLSSGTTYFYRVRGIVAGVATSNSNTTTQITAPAAPVAAAATNVAATSFDANWGAVTGAASYRLDVSTDNFSTTLPSYTDLTVTGTSQSVTGLTGITTYQYRVRAVNGGGASAPSNTISATTTGTASIAVTTPGNEAGPVNVVYTVTLSATNNTGSPITFDVANGAGTAVAGSDFTAFAGTAAVSVANGATTGTLTVTVTDDALIEATETVQATISNPSHTAVTVAGASATANITDNDAANAVLSVTTQGNETGPVSIVYTVTLSKTNNTGAPITFDVAQGAGTATVTDDFTSFAGAAAISVADGASTGTLTVTVVDDALVEGTETVQATISNPSNAAVTVTGASAVANITDSDAADAVLSVTTQGNEAGPVNIVYTVTLSKTNNTGSAITFDVAQGAGTATVTDDFTAFAGAAAINVADGATTGTLTVTVADDALLEGTETVQATISNPSGTATINITGASATASITDDESANAALSVTTQGDEAGPVNIVYTVTLSATNNTGSAITFDVANGGGTAVAGSDFTAFAGSAAVSVANGATTGTLTVTVTDDALLEATETVQATISNPSGTATINITGASATANITDNDAANAVLSVTTQGNETGPVSIVYTVTLSKTNNTGTPITFDVAQGAGTATVTDDFTAFAGAAAISVADGASTGTLTVPVVDDALVEGTETVQTTISSPSNAAVTVTGASAVANITDSDAADAVLSVTTQGEEAGPVNIVYTVTLSKTNNTGSAITFDVAQGAGTATVTDDFTAFAGAAAINVADGATTGTLTVTVADDALLEGTETVQATISNPSGTATINITGASATANITDDESADATLAPTQDGDEAGLADIIYTVTLTTTNNTGAAITFDIAASGGTAVAGTNYTAFPGGQDTIANGATSGDFHVAVVSDGAANGNKTLQTTISNPSGTATINITGASATANIVDAPIFLLGSVDPSIARTERIPASLFVSSPKQ
jgi:hypothetical protein